MKLKKLILLIPFIYLYACNSKSNEKTGEITTNDFSDATTAQKTTNITPLLYEDIYKDVGITGINYSNGQFDLDFLGESMRLGAQDPNSSDFLKSTAIGHHIEIHILGKDCIEANGTPIKYALEDGVHDLVVFSSTSHNISVKNPKAQIAARVTIANGKLVNGEMIPYSYILSNCNVNQHVNSDGTAIFDFYIRGATLGLSHMVELTLNGKSFAINKWQPVVLHGLKKGDNLLEVKLRNNIGGIVESPVLPLQVNYFME